MFGSFPVTVNRALGSLPTVLARGIHTIPFSLQRRVLTHSLEYLFRETIEDGDFDFLEERCFRVHIKDVGINWYFTSRDRQLAVSRYGQADACISGNLREFLQLISRREDPDTLFFQRRLMIEGDTETGLQIKNLLDELDLDSAPGFVRKGLEGLCDITCTLQDLPQSQDPSQERAAADPAKAQN